MIPEQTYRTWLEPTDALAIEGSTLLIGAPDQFSADWNESKHADLLSSFSAVALGHPMRVRFKVAEERIGRVQMDMFVQPPANPVVAPPTAHQQRLSAPLNPRYTFDQFVIGKSNDVAAAAAQAAAQAPGKVYNPLFIYGDTGLGKTHLMQGIAHELLKRTPTSITVATIQQVVSREWGVTPDGLRSKTRTKQLTTPRQVAMYLCRELLALQLVEIGSAFGGRDHSTVIHSLDRVAEDMGQEPGFADRVLKVRGMLETLRSTGQLGS